MESVVSSVSAQIKRYEEHFSKLEKENQKMKQELEVYSNV